MVKRFFTLAVCAMSATVFADVTRYLNSDEFIAAAPDVLNVQGFESSQVDTASAQHDSLAFENITIATPEPNLSIHNAIQFGQAPAAGSNYLRISGGTEAGGSEVYFQFHQPVTQLGMYIIDWGDGTQSGIPHLTAVTDSGDQLEIASGLQTDGNVIFFGFQSTRLFSELTIYNDISTDSWAIDEVYFGTPEPATMVLLACGSFILIRRTK